MPEVGSLFVRLKADASEFNKAMQGVHDKFKGVSKQTRDVGQSLSLGVTAPLVGIGLAAINIAADYESGMNMLQAVSGATGDQMSTLGDLAVQLGNDVTLPGTSAADAAAAMTELAKAGLSINDVMGASKGVLQLSAAGQISNAQAAALTANALNTFGLKGTEAVRVADLLAAGANASSADVDTMGQALQQAGAVAAMNGVPIEDLTTAIALMANAGIEGSDAGTSLKTMMIRLTAPTEKSATLMDDLGISVFDAQGNLKSMPDIIKEFNKATGDMTQEQRAAAYSTIFGTDAVRAASIVLDGGVGAFNNMKTAVTQQGAAQELAAAKMKGLNGAMEALRGVIETLFIQLAGPALGFLASLALKVGGLVESFGNLSPPIRNAILAFLGIMAAAGPVLLVISGIAAAIAFVLTPIGAIVVGIALLTAAFIALQPVIGPIIGFISDNLVPALITLGPLLGGIAALLIGMFVPSIIAWTAGVWASVAAHIAAAVAWLAAYLPIIAILVAVGAAAALLYAAWNSNFLGIQDITFAVIGAVSSYLLTAWEAIKTAASAVWTAIQAAISAAGAAITAVINGVVAAAHAVADAWNWLKETAAAIWAGIVAGVTAAGAAIGAAWTAIKDAVVAVWEAIKGAIQTAIDAVGSAIDTAMGAIKSAWETTWNAIKAVAETVWGAIKALVETYITGVQTIVETTLGIIQGIWETVWGAIQTTAETIWGAIKAFIELEIEGIRTIIETTLGVIQGIWETVFGAIQTTAETIWTAIHDFIDEKINAAKDAIDTATDTAKDLVEDAFEAIRKSVEDKLKAAVSLVEGLPGRITSALGDLSDLLWDAGAAVIGGFIDGIKSMIPDLGGVLGGITSSITDLKGPPKKDKKLLVKNGLLTMGGFERGLMMGMPSIERTLGDFTNSLSGNVQVAGGAGGGVTVNITGPIYARNEAEVDLLANRIGDTVNAKLRARGQR